MKHSPAMQCYQLMQCVYKGSAVPIFENGRVGVLFPKK